MTTIKTRNSVLGLVIETTEGVGKFPTGAGDFTALQDDFTMSPEINVLSSAELKPSIGMAKGILGMEAPTASLSHYLRHSGVEGTEPDYAALIKSAFGAQETESTEYDTVSSSTTTVVKVNTGEGAQFARGQALLVKHATNAWEIRPIHSVSGDDLTVGFALTNAPASGVNLGKSVTFSPASADHPTVSLVHYLGNGGATQMIAGARVTEMSVEFPAGEFINASFSLEGTSYYFNPIEITASSKYLDFTDDNGTYAAVVATGIYKHPAKLAEAVAAAMALQDGAETFTCTYSNTTGKFTIASSTSTLLTLKWSTGTNTANTIGTKLGFVVSADDTGATSYVADNTISIAAPYTPTLDSSDPLVAKDNRVMIGDATDSTCFPASSVTFTLSNSKTDILSTCAESGKSGSVVSAREVTIAITSLLNQYDANKFARYVENTDTRFAYVFGSKTGGNWTAGKCGCIYVPTATITAFNLTDADGLVTLEMELKAYVNDAGEGEAYLSFV